MERAIGTTFKVGNDEFIVQEVKTEVCYDEHGKRCYFYKKCLESLQLSKIAGYCTKFYRTDGKSVIFIKK